MGYLAQDSSVFRQLSVEDNLMAILETRKAMTRKQRKARQNELLDQFGLTTIRKTKANRVSGGERRRLEIARSLITEPKLIMLDEVEAIEGVPIAEWKAPTAFDNLTPLFPQGRIMLENSKTNSISARAVDLLTPLGRGQRGLIVAAPRVGKTILLKEIAKAIRANHPEILLMVRVHGTPGSHAARIAGEMLGRVE